MTKEEQARMVRILGAVYAANERVEERMPHDKQTLNLLDSAYHECVMALYEDGITSDRVKLDHKTGKFGIQPLAIPSPPLTDTLH